MEQHKTIHFFISITKLVLRTLTGISWKTGAQLGLMAAFPVGGYTFPKRVPLLTHPLSWNIHQWHAWPSTQHTSLGASFGKGQRRKQGWPKHAAAATRDTTAMSRLRGTINRQKRVKGTDWSLLFSTHELGSSAMVLGTRLKRRLFITCGMLCQSLAQTEKLMWIPNRDCKYFWDTKTQTPAGSENTLSWKQADSRRVSGYHIHFLYSFPSVVISEHEMLFKQTLVFNTHGHFSISPAIFSYCYLQLLAVSSRVVWNTIPCKTYSE